MSAVEEALERIRVQSGVQGYVICNCDGIVLRRSASIAKPIAENIALSTTKLAENAKNVTRDLNPNDDLKNLRIKTSRKELVVSHDIDFIVIVIQEWTPAKEEQSHLPPPAS